MSTKPTWFDTSIENALLAHKSPEDGNGYFAYQLDSLK